MANLIFGMSKSLAAFKAENGESMKIIRNPHTGKVFFSCGDKIGAVAAKTVANNFQGNLRVVDVTDGEEHLDGEEHFLLLCNESSDNVITTL